MARHAALSVRHAVVDPTWWAAAGHRAAWTAVAAATSWVALVILGEVTPLYAAGVIAGTVLASIATSLVSLPEVTGRTVPLWQAVLARVLRQAGQTAAPVLTAAVWVGDVDWPTLGRALAIACAVTLLRTLATALEPTLPEITTPTSPTA